jgi:hypothetical protein
VVSASLKAHSYYAYAGLAVFLHGVIDTVEDAEHMHKNIGLDWACACARAMFMHSTAVLQSCLDHSGFPFAGRRQKEAMHMNAHPHATLTF